MPDPRYPYPPFLAQIPLDGHAVIEASAGTGKTYAIERIVVALVLGGLSIEELLVVTFTEKAAVELKARIRRLLQDLLSLRETPPGAQDPCWTIDEDARRALERALFSFDRATISTIHGFCHGVLRELAFDAGMRFGLDLTDGRSAFRRAFRAELREHIGVDEEASALLEQWLRETKESYSPADGRLSQADLLEALLYDAYRFRYLEGGLASAEGLRETLGALGEEFDLDFLIEEYEVAAIRNEDRSRAQETLRGLDRVLREAVGRPEALSDPGLRLDFQSLLAPRGTNPGKLRRKFPDGLAERTQRFLGTLRQLRSAQTLEQQVVARFLPGTVDRLERDKRNAGLLDYDDMLLWLRDALLAGGNAPLRAALTSRYRHALIDEFQDTDDVQWGIFRTLFVQGEGGGRLHVVGDPKQAIYAFRGADVFAYLSAREDLRRRGVVPIPLTENFRGTAPLIEATNLILAQSAPSPLFPADGEIRYEPAVTCGRPGRRVECDAGSVSPITLLALSEGAGLRAPRARALLGRRIAAIIGRMLDDPAHHLRVLDPGEDPRTVRASGIFVLTRTGREALEIAEYLRERGVPFSFYKQDGLFQTREAYEVLDVLRAVRDPAREPARLRAWKSAFFAIPLRDLDTFAELPDTHPLHRRLLRWKELAERRSFAALFDALLHESGLVAREIFLSSSERQLTNYLHLFEVLLEEATRRRLGLADVIELLESYISGTSGPPGRDGNVQRLESERDAVQIMTVHKSKGLEADVVFLFGGATQPRDRNRVAVYHAGGLRRVVVGKEAKKDAKDLLDAERAQEDRRLAYVAITRPRVKLFLPLLPPGSTRKAPAGYYAPLNARLLDLADPVATGDAVRPLFEVDRLGEGGPGSVPRGETVERIATWAPPEALLAEERERDRFDRLRRDHAPLVTESYTSLKHARTGDPAEFEPEAFKEDRHEPAEGAAEDLPAGPETGVFLHEAIEKLDLGRLASAASFEAWAEDEQVRAHFADLMRRHRIAAGWKERAQRMVFTALRSPIPVGDAGVVDGLGRCAEVRELEFLYPIPERGHPLLSGDGGGGWPVERGYLKGFVDYVFRHGGRTYFADWKSDRLAGYDPMSLRACVAERYPDQVRIYTLGILRLLGIRDRETYETRFGGLLYLFLRGLRAEGGADGVHFDRPRWEDVLAIEEGLLGLDVGRARA